MKYAPAPAIPAAIGTIKPMLADIPAISNAVLSIGKNSPPTFRAKSSKDASTESLTNTQTSPGAPRDRWKVTTVLLQDYLK